MHRCFMRRANVVSTVHDRDKLRSNGSMRSGTLDGEFRATIFCFKILLILKFQFDWTVSAAKRIVPAVSATARAQIHSGPHDSLS